MTSANGIAIDIGTFTANSDLKDDAIHVAMTGEGDTSALSALEDVLKRVHAAATERKLSEVILDLRRVSFMNSSCFTKLIAWVNRVRELPVDARYKIRLQSNQELLWQRRSLHALQCFAVELITIEA